MATTAPIIVGVDGSEGSQRALAWALEEARRLDAPVRVVHAWWTPPEYADAERDTPGEENDAARQQAAERMVADMLAEVADVARGLDVDIEVVNDHPATMLIDRSEWADRIVLGTRGVGGFKALMLGSVTQQVVPHADCPVVVIPSVF